jgi:4-carboxymuconolactone decarboxylase
MANEQCPAQKAYGDIARALADLSDRVLFSEVWERSGLRNRDRTLVMVESLVARYYTNELSGHLKRALDSGVMLEELVELVTPLAFCASWPVANSAVPILRKTLDDADASKHS